MVPLRVEKKNEPGTRSLLLGNRQYLQYLAPTRQLEPFRLRDSWRDEASLTLGLCRWMSRSAMRPAEGDASDCVLVVGISRPKMAVAFLSVALLSLFLTFHILYDSAIYSLHAVSAVEGRTVELVSQVCGSG